MHTKEARMKTIQFIAVLAVAGLMAAPVGAGEVTKKDGPVYTVQVNTAKKGPKSAASIKVTPKKGYHCNMLYPWKVSAKASEGVKYDKEVLKKADAKKFTEQDVTFEVVYKAKAGKKAGATVKMSLCDEKQCERYKVDLDF